MLPKEEKIKKTPDEKQPGLFDKEDEKKRLAKKRRFIYIAMILTVGLSSFFWIYHSIKNTKFSFKLPTLNFKNSSVKSNSIKTVTDFSLPKNTNSTWSFFLKNLDSNSIIYQSNQDIIFTPENLDTILVKINKTDYITSSVYTSTLPEGLKIKEIVEENNNQFSYISEIITPNQKLLLIIKITDSSDLTRAKDQVSSLVEQLYWSSLQK